MASGGGVVLLLFPLITTHTVYARIPANQFVLAGACSDMVLIMVLITVLY